MTTPARTLVHDRLATLSDATRCRLLLALEGHELMVGELCQALQLPQSTVSRHLRILAADGWVESRAEGANRWYAVGALDDDATALWAVVRAPVAETAAGGQDRARVAAVVAARRDRSAAFFADTAGSWDTVRTQLYGPRADLSAALSLLDANWVVGDLGCGTGALSAALAPHVRAVLAVDASPAMLDAARARLALHQNVKLVPGTLEALPIDAASLDAAVLILVLHHVAEPVSVLREARRVLKPGGRLLMCDMQPHEQEEYRQEMGHVWLGFSEGTVREWCAQAGFAVPRYRALSVDASATGPTLFVATTTPDDAAGRCD